VEVAGFKDDGVLSYKISDPCNDPRVDDWLSQSRILGDKCKKEREKEEKMALDLEKKRQSLHLKE